jgi:anti-sigma B factor antagonist
LRSSACCLSDRISASPETGTAQARPSKHREFTPATRRCCERTTGAQERRLASEALRAAAVGEAAGAAAAGGDTIAPTMKAGTRKVGEVVIVDIEGRLVVGDGDQILRKTVDDLLADGRRKIVLNLAGVPAIDSFGVGELVASKKVADGVGAKLKLLETHGRVRHVLDSMLLLPIFESFDDEADALASFS